MIFRNYNTNPVVHFRPRFQWWMCFTEKSMKACGIFAAAYIGVSIVWTILIYHHYELILTGYGLYLVLGPISCLQGLFYGHAGIAFSLIAWSIPLIVFPILVFKAKTSLWMTGKIFGWLFFMVYWIGIVIVDGLLNV